MAEDDLARIVVDVVPQLELTTFYAPYRADGWGHPVFHPEMMVSLLVYAYCVGERSSRQIERLCQRDIAFRFIMGNRVPDHATIARFRQEHQEALATLVTQVLRICREAGLGRGGVVAVDGTNLWGSYT